MKLYRLEEKWEQPIAVFANSPEEAMLKLLKDHGDYGLAAWRNFVEYTLPTDGTPIMLDDLVKEDLLTIETTDPFLLIIKEAGGVRDWLEEYWDKKSGEVYHSHSKKWDVDKENGDIIYFTAKSEVEE